MLKGFGLAYEVLDIGAGVRFYALTVSLDCIMRKGAGSSMHLWQNHLQLQQEVWVER